MTFFIEHKRAEEFLRTLNDDSVDLFLIDPPYYGIVEDSWDNQWKDIGQYLKWLALILGLMREKAKPRCSLILFQGIGTPEQIANSGGGVIDSIRTICGRLGWFYRNWITWKKRRGYGKSRDYLFCREEILWFSASPVRTDVTFNVPLLKKKRGYLGFNKKYPAKSEYMRVSNVWIDIPELMRPERNCQKPIPLLERLIETHSNEGDLVVDCFSGWGSTGVAAVGLERRFRGCEALEKDAREGDERVNAAYNERCESRGKFEALRERAKGLPERVTSVAEESSKLLSRLQRKYSVGASAKVKKTRG